MKLSYPILIQKILMLIIILITGQILRYRKYIRYLFFRSVKPVTYRLLRKEAIILVTPY